MPDMTTPYTTAIEENLDVDSKNLMTHLVTTLTFDTPKAVSLTSMAKEMNININRVRLFLNPLILSSFVIEVGKKGNVMQYVLNPNYDASIEGTTKHGVSENMDVLTTKAGTEVATIFKAIDDVIENNDNEDLDDYEYRYYSEDYGEDFKDWPLRALRTYSKTLGYKGRAMNRSILTDWLEANRKTIPFVTDEIAFQYVKSNLHMPELEKLTERMQKLASIIKQAQICGQTALYETLAVELAGVVREQEIVSCNLGIWISRKTIKKVIGLVKGKTCKFSNFETFPRIVPNMIANTIAKVMKKNIFDSYHILYIDSSDQAKLETNATKIERKDPILFGAIAEHPDKLYYIIDWTDEFCDMTLAKMLDYVRIDDPEFALDQIPEVTPEYINSVIEDSKKKKLRLKNTNIRSWRRMMEREEEETRKVEADARKKAQLGTDSSDPVVLLKNMLSSFVDTWMEQKGKHTTFETEEDFEDTYDETLNDESDDVDIPY